MDPSKNPQQHTSTTDETTPLLDPPADNQTQTIHPARFYLIFPALTLVQFTAFLDLTAITTALPAIASSLRTDSSISWVAASFLTTSTSIQLLNGQFSDIFGRKACLITALSVMALGNLLSGFSQTPAQLYVTRAISGFGAGALNSLVQICISDFTTLEQRGSYFGIVGIAVGLGNGLGPLIGGALTEGGGWRWAFWFICPLAMVAVGYLVVVMPGTEGKEGVWGKCGRVDWVGVGFSMVAVVLILVPLSQGGAADAWSTVYSTMFVSGILLFTGFVILEFWVVKMPIMPIRFFQCGASANILIISNFILGWIFWGNLFYLPLYMQVVRGWTPTLAGTYMLPMVIAHGVFSWLSGILVSYWGRYVPVISAGIGFWVVGLVWKTTFGVDTPAWMIWVRGVFEGIGVGCTMQTILVGLFASTPQADRAGFVGLRNFIRTIGSVVGITVSSAILSIVLQYRLKDHFSAEFISTLISSAYGLMQSDISIEDKQLIVEAYMSGLTKVFISHAILAIGLFILTFFIHDYGFGGREKDFESNKLPDVNAGGTDD